MNTMSYSYSGEIAAVAGESARATFLRKTYVHLVGGIGAFIILQTLFLNSPLAEPFARFALGGGFNWLIVLGGYMVASMFATRWASEGASPSKAYLGYSLYLLAMTPVFGVLLFVASNFGGGAPVILYAGVTTIAVFTALTAIVFITGKDFSFLRSALMYGGFAAMGLIVASFFLPFSLGVWFPIAMVVLMGASILYQTSNILHHYRTDQYVAASLGLLASIATMFWYILQLFMSRD